MNTLKKNYCGAAIVLFLLAIPTAGQGEYNMQSQANKLRSQSMTFEFDIPYAGTDNPRQCLDIYLPKQPKSDKLPVVVFIHGGAWLEGDKSNGTAPLKPFVRSGKYAGVSVGYRLSSEAIWPAQIHDCKAAIRWVRAHSDKYKLDPDRIAVWGRSAGAHLALMLGVSSDTPKLEGDIGAYDDFSSKVSGVANFFGPTDLVAMANQSSDMNHNQAQSPEGLLIGGAIHDNIEKARAASPITYITPNDVPVLTIHGDADPTVPYAQAVLLDKALSKAGVPSYFISVIGGGHGGFPDEAIDRTEDFFSKVLLDEQVDTSTKPLNQTESN